MTDTNNKKPFPKVPDEAIVKPEDEKPVEVFFSMCGAYCRNHDN